MPGTPQKRARMFKEREAELEELGLLGVYLECPAEVRRDCRQCLANGAGSCGRGEDCGLEDCGRPVVRGRLRCIAHRWQDISANQIATSIDLLKEYRAYLTNQLAPLALSAVGDTLSDEQATHADRLRASAMVLDRAGMPAGQQIQIESNVTVLPPPELLRQAVSGIRERMESAGVIQVEANRSEEDQAALEPPE